MFFWFESKLLASSCLLWMKYCIYSHCFAYNTVTVATVIGTLVAFLLVPMRSLGQDSWKIAACLMGSYIGGGILLINEVL